MLYMEDMLSCVTSIITIINLLVIAVTRSSLFFFKSGHLYSTFGVRGIMESILNWLVQIEYPLSFSPVLLRQS